MAREGLSWAVITTRFDSEATLLEALNSHYIFLRKKFNPSKSVSENIMESVGYRLEYSIPQRNGKIRHIYVWDNMTNFMYPIKEAYSLLGVLHKAKCDIVGMAEDMGSLYWVKALHGKKIEVKTLFFSNVERGFYHEEDMPHLQSTLDYINIKERSMLVLGGSSFANWFQRIQNVIDNVQNTDIND